MRMSDGSSDECSSELILEEGADIGIADSQRLLSRNWRSEDKREGGRYFEEMSGHWPCKVRAIGTTAAPRSTIREIRAPGTIWFGRACRSPADLIGRPFTCVTISPDWNPAF